MSHQASGQFIPGQGEDDGELIIQGEYSYIGDDGQTYTVKYIADKDGYRVLDSTSGGGGGGFGGGAQPSNNYGAPPAQPQNSYAAPGGNQYGRRK